MRYILPILTLLAMLFSCANPEPEPDNTVIYDHSTPRQLGKLMHRTTLQEGDGWKTKWYYFDFYTINIDYENDTLESVHIDHRIGFETAYEITDCCFQAVRERPDTCWWWGQLPNQVRSEIAARKYTPQ